MTDRKLVVYEDDPAANGYGRLHVIAPNQATGIPIPAFMSGPSTPATGTLAGQAFLNTTNKIAYVWDGRSWNPIVPADLVVFPDDNTLRADTGTPAGSYAAATDTGNFYMRTTTGWHHVGITVYPTEAGLLTDTPGDGSIGFALDTVGLFGRVAGAWVPFDGRTFPDITGLQAWTPPDGQKGYIQDKGLSFIRQNGNWAAQSLWADTEANILADLTLPAGQSAVSTDNGRLYVFDGTQWHGSPIRHYNTEVTLLADSPPNGTLAWADNTGLVYARAGGVWRRVNSPTVTVGTTVPRNPAAGDIFCETTHGKTQIWDGNQWKDLGGGGKIEVGNAPAVADREPGLLWWNDGALWIWDAAGVWVET